MPSGAKAASEDATAQLNYKPKVMPQRVRMIALPSHREFAIITV
jgi:hypothetical protein